MPAVESRTAQLKEFVAWAAKLKGDEKGEAQIFLDRLFRAFSRGGVNEAGATCEMRVKNDRGGTAFADLVWKPIVLIEMKRRGEDLSKHLQQAFNYWTQLVPGRPRYVVLCNFDEFRIYDFEQDINEPADTVTLAELPERYGPLNFLWPTRERPHFKVDREKVTREAADMLAGLYRTLRTRRDVTPDTAQRFVLQCLVALFSEDIGLLPKHFFKELLEDCIDPPKAFDLLDGLFKAMNTKAGAKGGRFKNVEYFNGGIFAKSAAIELEPDNEIAKLKAAATYQWKYVSPDIFGTIFQHSMEAEERHALGAHYTAQTDIMKIVGPTIVAPFTTALERCKTPKDFNTLRTRLQSLRVLDPACGSGNFLYVAYREMRRLEAAINAREMEGKRAAKGQMAFSGVSPKQFYGLDIIPFAVELAKVTLALAPKLAADELHTTEPTLPLDNLDGNIQCRDALIDDKGKPAPWPAADVIIGNPPFLGAKRLKPERGADYVNAIREAYPNVPGMADYCVFWFRRAHDHLPDCTPADPFRGRAGLVGTQNIRNNKSREGGLDHIVKSGVIVEAVDNQPWSGEANVHVSIANWVKHAPTADEDLLLIPEQRLLWTKVESELPLLESDAPRTNPKTVTRGKRGRVRGDKSYELAFRLGDSINASLTDIADVTGARALKANCDPQLSFNGQMIGHEAFLLTSAEARQLVHADGKTKKVLFPYLNGREFLTGDGRPLRWVLDFGERDQLEASQFGAAFEYVEQRVLPDRKRKAQEGRSEQGKGRPHHEQFLRHWWRLSFGRPELCDRLRRISRYMACSLVTKRAVFVFVDSAIRPSNLLQVFTLEDDYSFGVMQSATHWMWFAQRSSKLKSDYRFGESVWTTFPWPQSPTKRQVRAVAEAGRAIRAVRDAHLPKMKGGLRALYRTLELPGKNPLKDAHAALDAAVLDAYGFSAKKDLLKQLLDLNLAVAAREERGWR